MNLAIEEKWSAVEERIGGERGGEIVSALKELHSVYDERFSAWVASLYCPEVGGWYYSVSARDNDGFLPDVESTVQVLGFIESSGMIGKRSYKEALPDWLKERVGRFVYPLQDVDGYFYHPQWGKEVGSLRAARDVGTCQRLLSFAGLEPKYPIPGANGNASAYDINLAPEMFKSVDNYKKYLYEELDFKTRAYHSASVLSSQWGQIKFFGRVLGVDLCGFTMEYLDSLQRPENGLWHETDDYFGINGVHKMSWIYGTERKMPYAMKAVETTMRVIMSDTPAGATVDVYNPWHVLAVLFGNLEKAHGLSEDEIRALRERYYCFAPAAIRKSAEKIRVFKKPDGGMSYKPGGGSCRPYGTPAAVPNSNEGDINGAMCGSFALMNNVYAALGLSDIKVPMFDENEYARFMKTVTDKENEYRRSKGLEEI